MRKLLLLGGILLSVVLIWFTTSNYQSAHPIAEENLRGLALSLTSAIENIALHDPSLRNLETFKSNDTAFFALINREGVYRFHTNQDLIGTSTSQGDIKERHQKKPSTKQSRYLNNFDHCSGMRLELNSEDPLSVGSSYQDLLFGYGSVNQGFM